MIDPTIEKCRALVEHLVRRLYDDPEFIECSGKLTRTYELLLDAASAVYRKPREQIAQQIQSARKEIESYRPLVSHATRFREERDRAHVALNKIIDDHLEGDEARRVAEEGLG